MGFPNTYHSGGWRVIISNIPTMTDITEMKYFDNYCKSIVLPDYNILEYMSFGPEMEMERHPISKKNEDLSQLQIDFKISEDFKNYLRFFEWMMSIRYGQIDTRLDDRLFQNTIQRITISLLDNEKRDIADIYFTELRLVNLSSIALDHGSEEEIIFTTNFTYREVGFELKEV
jgi:hypothetical protein